MHCIPSCPVSCYLYLGEQLSSEFDSSPTNILAVVARRSYCAMDTLYIAVLMSLVTLDIVLSDIDVDSLSRQLEHLSKSFLDTMHSDQDIHTRDKRSESISSQTVYQFQKKPRKCKNLKSYGIASGSNALR